MGMKPVYRNEVEQLWCFIHDITEDYWCRGFRHEGLRFKTSDNYLTAAGYPLDTVCWYVRCHTSEGRVVFCGDTQVDVLKKVAAFFERRLKSIKKGEK